MPYNRQTEDDEIGTTASPCELAALAGEARPQRCEPYGDLKEQEGM